MNAPTDAPGCFASASIYANDSSVCQRCVAYDACSAASLETLEAIKGIVNIDDFMKRHHKARSAAQVAMKESDEVEAAALPPGNVPQPTPERPVERKTKVVQVTFEVSEDEQSIIAKLNKKPGVEAVRLCSSGMIPEIRKCITDKRNPFTEKPRFLRVAFDLLLSGGFSRHELRDALVSQLSWEPSSAVSHVAIATDLLLAFGFIQENAGRFVFAPESGS